jgi:hypothetical protein
VRFGVLKANCERSTFLGIETRESRRSAFCNADLDSFLFHRSTKKNERQPRRAKLPIVKDFV